MLRVTRTFSTDLDDLAYQIGRSEQFARIHGDFTAHRIPDDEAQGRLADLLETGVCRLEGDRGPETWEWVLNEAQGARLLSKLYLEHMGGH